MDDQTCIQLTPGDTIQDTLSESFTADHEHESSNNASNGDSVLDNADLFPSSASPTHLGLVTDIDIEAHEPQSPIHSFEPDQEPSDIQTAENKIDYEDGRTQPQSTDQVTLPTISKEAPSSERSTVLASESTPTVTSDDSEASTTVYSQEPPLLHARTVSSETAVLDKREVGSDGHLHCVQTLQTKLDPAHLTDEEGTREDFDYTREDFPSSLPPSSSPPQLLSSSPYASSQSSDNGVEPSKMPQPIGVKSCASPHGYTRSDVAPVVQDALSHTIADVATSLENYSPTKPTSHTNDGLERSRKRAACQSDSDEPYLSPPPKHPKPDFCLYPPPAPKRATLVSQHRQFTKLAAPFRLPRKLPVVTDGLAQIMNDRETKPVIGTPPDTNHDTVDTKGSTTHLPLRNKALNPTRCVTQFKSPLVNRTLPAESRTVRLTPALQALERKLQLLKRAIKVKEDDEEKTLTRLVGKWIEAGREVAYDLWDATKDAGDFEGKGKAISTRKSYGWESTDNGNTLWGWDTKPDDATEESCGPDSSAAPCPAGRPVLEENDEICHNTLGTMLRQLGIALDIFGWDDEKETFYD